ncbi:MAG TPA: DNA polymerase III subunit delta [Xanthomonadaceae bacterium]|nr:DNA polymerase III subunit delta [Xanthomonadaceae bacterium]
MGKPTHVLARHLAADPLAPVWLIASGEPLLVMEAADAVRLRARELGYSERTVLEVDGRFDWADFGAALGERSLFASRRIIELRLPTGRPGREGAEAIAAFARDPVPDLLLLVLAGQWSRSHEVAWVKAVDKAGVLLPLWPPRSHELPGWIRDRMAARGLAADHAATGLIAERVEGNLLAAAQEIDKLLLLKGPGRLDVDELARLIADSARFDTFGMTEAALSGDAPRALRMLRGLRAEGEAIQRIVAWLSGQIATAVELATVKASGGNLGQAMQRAGLWQSRQGAFRSALARADARHFERLLADLAHVDQVSKGRPPGDAWLELERLLLALAQPPLRRKLGVGA